MQRVCVFLGSSPGKDAAYKQAAIDLAEALVEKKLTLVYGGSDIGLMGILADAVLDCGGQVVGVIPEWFVSREVSHDNLTQIHIVQSMHERKAKMAGLSDGFIAMPGGLGTFEELFEVWTWAQLGFHDKPCGLLNVAGYYDSLLDFLDRAVEQGFVRSEHRHMMAVEARPGILLQRLMHYQSEQVDKWIDRT